MKAAHHSFKRSSSYQNSERRDTCKNYKAQRSVNLLFYVSKCIFIGVLCLLEIIFFSPFSVFLEVCVCVFYTDFWSGRLASPCGCFMSQIGDLCISLWRDAFHIGHMHLTEVEYTVYM